MKKSIIAVFLLLLVFTVTGSLLAFAAGGNDQTLLSDTGVVKNGQAGSPIYLYVGSPLILTDSGILPLDSENLDVVATCIEGHTLVPLRAVSEYFAAAVSYDSAKQRAVIGYGGKTYYFPINQEKYLVDQGRTESTVTMDTAARSLNQRTLVPLRVICRDILKLNVSYKNNVIGIFPGEVKNDDATLKEVKTKIGMAVKVNTLNELTAAMQKNSGPNYAVDNVALPAEVPVTDNGKAADTAGNESASATGTASDSDYSRTNTQVAGIDEADIVKTDGKYIYIAGNNAVRIVKAVDGKLSEAGVIKLPQNKSVQEIYVDGDRLVLLGNRYEQQNYDPGTVYPMKAMPGGAAVATDIAIMPPYYSKNFSFMDVYDISDPGSPVYLKGHETEGSYQSSRKNGEIVYLITSAYPYDYRILPVLNDTVGNKETTGNLAVDDVMILPDYPAYGYVVLSAMNIKDNAKAKVEAIAASGYITYMNDHALYLAAGGYNGSSSIIKFAIDGLNMGYAGSGQVPGDLLNQFSMDEYNGHLRVATTIWGNANDLFILDDSLNVCGSVEGFSAGERIYSVRFMGDKGYVVTYRNLDPLFVFDLTDPQKPVITGELTIPGFSNYLQPVGDNLILGIGEDTYDIYRKNSTGNDEVIGTRTGGIKLSLFDVSDQGKPQEIAKYVLGDSGSYSEAFYNHKAVMYDLTNSCLAFDASIAPDSSKSGDYQQGAVVMSFAGDKFTLKGILSYQQPEVYGMYIPYGRRVLYIGDELYYVQDGIVSSYNYQTLKAIDTLMLK